MEGKTKEEGLMQNVNVDVKAAGSTQAGAQAHLHHVHQVAKDEGEEEKDVGARAPPLGVHHVQLRQYISSVHHVQMWQRDGVMTIWSGG